MERDFEAKMARLINFYFDDRGWNLVKKKTLESALELIRM
jgi:hypothetical protein